MLIPSENTLEALVLTLVCDVKRQMPTILSEP